MNIQSKTASQSRPSRLRRIAPVIGLLFLAPWVGEFLLGNIEVGAIIAIPLEKK